MSGYFFLTLCYGRKSFVGEKSLCGVHRKFFVGVKSLCGVRFGPRTDCHWLLSSCPVLTVAKISHLKGTQESFGDSIMRTEMAYMGPRAARLPRKSNESWFRARLTQTGTKPSFHLTAPRGGRRRRQGVGRGLGGDFGRGYGGTACCLASSHSVLRVLGP